MKPITLFSWGYYGWGNWTKQLVKAVDAVEESRGFKPPIFVDVRIRREVRAPGFRGAEFEKLLRPDRYRWIRDLGNESIITHAKRMKIRDPSAASDLLELAATESKAKRRLIFFCSCRYPNDPDKGKCHRTEVARLVLNAAREQNVRIETVEWPGGNANDLNLNVAPEVFRAVANGSKNISLGSRPRLSQVAGLAFGTVATLRAAGSTLHRVVGPATYGRDEWRLPVLAMPDSLGACQKESPVTRKRFGYEPRTSS